jgi:hypothetical protein
MDTCPTHEKPITGEYDFGWRDAIVVTYACGCADVIDCQNFSAVTHCRNYHEAEGKARLIVALNR